MQNHRIIIQRPNIDINTQNGLKMIKMIDPPAGWKYGFPKAISDDVTDVIAWLVENGYPQEEIDSLGEHFYWREWEEDAEA